MHECIWKQNKKTSYMDYSYDYNIFMNECIWIIKKIMRLWAIGMNIVYLWMSAYENKEKILTSMSKVTHSSFMDLDFESGHQVVSSFQLACVIAMQNLYFSLHCTMKGTTCQSANAKKLSNNPNWFKEYLGRAPYMKHRKLLKRVTPSNNINDWASIRSSFKDEVIKLFHFFQPGKSSRIEICFLFSPWKNTYG